jgi:prevent-host-death family protein
MASKGLEGRADARVESALPRFPSVGAAAAAAAVGAATEHPEPTSVGIRQLARNVSGVVADVVSSGRPTVVTKRGQPVAIVVSLRPCRLGDRLGTDDDEQHDELAAPMAVDGLAPGSRELV